MDTINVYRCHTMTRPHRARAPAFLLSFASPYCRCSLCARALYWALPSRTNLTTLCPRIPMPLALRLLIQMPSGMDTSDTNERKKERARAKRSVTSHTLLLPAGYVYGYTMVLYMGYRNA